MSHLVGVVVQAYDGFPLLNAWEQHHQIGVRHHQVQVILGQVKVHRLVETGSGGSWSQNNEGHVLLFLCSDVQFYVLIEGMRNLYADGIIILGIVMN